MKNNIVTNLTLKQYQNKYKNYKKHLYTFTKKEVLDFDRQAGTIGEKYVLNKRRWALIGDTYYEIPKPIRPMWFKGLSAAGKLAACVIPVGVVGALGGAGYGIYAAIANNKTQVSDIEVIETGDTSELIENPVFKKQSNGDYVATLKMKSGHSVLDIEEFHISVDGKELTVGEGFEFDTSTNKLTIYGKSIPSKDSKITIKIKKAPEKIELKFVPDEVEIEVNKTKTVKVVESGTYASPYVYPAEGYDDYIEVVTKLNDEFTYTIEVLGKKSTKSLEGGYAVLTATIDGGISANCKVVVKDGVTPEKVTVTVTKDEQDGTGTVTGAGEYEAGSEVTLTATADAGYAFFGWIDKDDNLIKDNPLVIKDVYEDKEFKAVFGPSYLANLCFFDNDEEFNYCVVTLRDDVETPSSVVIPDQIKGKFIEYSTPERAKPSTLYKVDKIDQFAESDIKSITIPLSIETLNANLFEGCGSLNSVNFVDSEHYSGEKNLKIIPYKCFAECKSLTNITIPECITTIESLVFENSGLKTISLPQTLVDFDADVFDGTALTSVEFKDVDNAWLEYTDDSWTEAIFYPTNNFKDNAGHLNELTKNEGHLLNKCVVEVEATSTTINKGEEMEITFKGLLPSEEITEGDVYSLNDEVASVSLKDGKFMVKGESGGQAEIIVNTSKDRCGHIKFTINEALSIKGEHNVDIEEAQKTGESEGYYYETNKEGATIEVEVGGDLISIDDDTGKLTLTTTAINNGGYAKIIAKTENEISDEFDICIGSFDKLAFGTDETSGVTYAKKSSDDIEGDVIIPQYYYENNSLLTVQECGGADFDDSGFEDTKITKVVIPENITKISDNCFSRCDALSNVTFLGTPNGVEKIGSNAFKDCKELKTITIPIKCDYIGMNAFEGSGLTSAELSAGYTWNFTNSDLELVATEYSVLAGSETENANKLRYKTTDTPTSGYSDYCWRKQNPISLEYASPSDGYVAVPEGEVLSKGISCFEATIGGNCTLKTVRISTYNPALTENNFNIYIDNVLYTKDDLTIDSDQGTITFTKSPSVSKDNIVKIVLYLEQNYGCDRVALEINEG